MSNIVFIKRAGSRWIVSFDNREQPQIPQRSVTYKDDRIIIKRNGKWRLIPIYEPPKLNYEGEKYDNQQTEKNGS